MDIVSLIIVLVVLVGGFITVLVHNAHGATKTQSIAVAESNAVKVWVTTHFKAMREDLSPKIALVREDLAKHGLSLAALKESAGILETKAVDAAEAREQKLKDLLDTFEHGYQGILALRDELDAEKRAMVAPPVTANVTAAQPPEAANDEASTVAAPGLDVSSIPAAVPQAVPVAEVRTPYGQEPIVGM